MEWKELAGAVQNFGAIIIIALMVFKAPQIISQLSDMIQKVIGNIRETQTEALNVFKAEQDKLLTIVTDRFTAVEQSQVTATEALCESLKELKSLSQRVENLERAKSS